MPSIAELGQKVKAKYPTAYTNLSDQDVGQKVKQKYPDAYKDFSDEPTTSMGKAGSALSTIGRGAYDIAKGVVVNPLKALATPFAGFASGVKGLTGVEIPGTQALEKFSGVDFSKGPSTQQAGQLLGRAVDIGTVVPMIGAAGVGAAAAGTALKEGAVAGGKELLKKGAIGLAKNVPLDFGIGALYGTSQALEEGKKTPSEILPEAAKMGAFGAVATPVLGGLLGAGFRGLKAGGEALGVGLEKGATALERYAAPAEERVARTHEVVAREEPSMAQKAAGAMAKGMRAVTNIPYTFSRLVMNRFAPLEKAGLSQDTIEMVEGASPRGMAQAMGTVDKAIAMKVENPKVFNVADEVSMLLDEKSRLSRVNPKTGKPEPLSITGGRNIGQVQAEIDAALSTLSPQERQLADTYVKNIQQIFRDNLATKVKEGLVRPEDAQRMMQANPDYVRHDVADYATDPEFAGQSKRSYSVSESGVKKAKGSERQVLSVQEAIVNNALKDAMTVEHNRAMNAVIDEGAASGLGFVPGRTAENVKQTEQYAKELRTIREQVDARKKQLNETKKFIQEENAKIDSLNKRRMKIDRRVFRQQADEIDRLIAQRKQRLRETIDFVKREDKAVASLNAQLKAQENTFFNELAASSGENNDIERAYKQAVADRAQSEAIHGQSFTDIDLENGYQNFKREAQRRPWMLDATTDDAALKQRLADKVSVDDAFFSASATTQKSNDEMLDLFKERFNAERSAPEVQAGLIRRYEQAGARLTEQEARMAATEGKIAARTAGIGEAAKTQEQLQQELSDIQAIRSELRDYRDPLATAGVQGELEASRGAVGEAQKSISDLQSQIQTLGENGRMIRNDLKNYRENRMSPEEQKRRGLTKVSRMVEGIREDWYIPEDIGNALKGMDAPAARQILSIIRNAPIFKQYTEGVQLFKKAVTSLKPTFGIRNLARDLQEATTNVGFGVLKSINPRASEEELLYAAKLGAFPTGGILRENLTPEQIIKQRVEQLSQKSGFVGNVKRIAELPAKFAERSEELTRLAAFKDALSKGASPTEAARIARNSTVDFGKMGPVMQVLNHLIPFLNPATQGTANLIKAFEKNPTETVRRVAINSVVPQAILTSMNMRYKSYVDGISDNEKRTNWIIMIGEHEGKDSQGKPVTVPDYIKIPKGQSQKIIGAGIERAMTYAKQKYPEQTQKFITDLVGDLSPVTDANLLPLGLQQYLDIASNKAAFSGRVIEPEYTKIGGKKLFKTAEVQPEYRYNQYTSEVAKALGKLLKKSPYQIDYLISQTGILNDAIRAGNMLVKGVPEGATKFERAAKLPLLSSFIGSPTGTMATKVSQQKKQQKLEKTQQKIEKIMQSVNK